MIKKVFFILFFLSPSFVFADLLEDIDSLGGNDVLLERARKLNPEKSVYIVQDRIVNRASRSEVGFEFSGVAGGDAYVSTKNLGLNYTFHINPRWSLGLRGQYIFNKLSPEGRAAVDYAKRVVDETNKSLELIPDIDYPKLAGYVVTNWYPIYGKMNLYDLGIIHYDVYFLLGGGHLSLKNGHTLGIMSGMGFGLWVSQHLSSRLELRYETYRARPISKPKRMHLTTFGFSMGYLL